MIRFLSAMILWSACSVSLLTAAEAVTNTTPEVVRGPFFSGTVRGKGNQAGGAGSRQAGEQPAPREQGGLRLLAPQRPCHEGRQREERPAGRHRERAHDAKQRQRARAHPQKPGQGHTGSYGAPGRDKLSRRPPVLQIGRQGDPP